MIQLAETFEHDRADIEVKRHLEALHNRTEFDSYYREVEESLLIRVKDALSTIDERIRQGGEINRSALAQADTEYLRYFITRRESGDDVNYLDLLLTLYRIVIKFEDIAKNFGITLLHNKIDSLLSGIRL